MGLTFYRRTPTFTETTVSAGLLKTHSIKAGAWRQIHVLEGELIYRITDPRRPGSEQVLSRETPPGLYRAHDAA